VRTVIEEIVEMHQRDARLLAGEIDGAERR